MPAPKAKSKNSLEMVKADEGNDSLDSFIRQTIGKEPLISFSRAGDNPVQWIQLLHALDQQDSCSAELPGWPLLTPLKVQMQKCEKCSREFWSSINYRRHIRVHHRLRKLDKDSSRNRDLLGAFWDKLSEDDAKEILSFKDVSLQEVSGPSIVKSLTELVRKPGFFALPQYCLRAGSALLDIVQSRPSRFPLSSDELFSILDDASEKTFLCGPVVSVQKYIFNGEAGKIGLETKNLVACISFLVEQKLIEAWLADKDAEALRSQKLLMEEEEAAQRRQAELLERKRQKKLRQKEHRAKEQRLSEEVARERIDELLDAASSAQQPHEMIETDSDAPEAEASPDNRVSASLEYFQLAIADDLTDVEANMENVNGDEDVENGNFALRQIGQGNLRRRAIGRWHMRTKSLSNHVANGFYSTQHYQRPRASNSLKHGVQWEAKPVPNMVTQKWSRKSKADLDEESLKAVQNVPASHPDDKKRELMIGSISVSLGNSKPRDTNDLDSARDHCLMEHQSPQDMVNEKHNRPNSAQGGTSKSTVTFWRPVNHNGNGQTTVENGDGKSHSDDHVKADALMPDGIESSTGFDSESGTQNLEEALHPGSLHFSSDMAKTFLAERWKEAIATEHVKLVLTPNSEQSLYHEVGGITDVTLSKLSDSNGPIVPGSTDNRPGVAAYETTASAAAKTKFRSMPEKGVKVKYIPKQRTVLCSKKKKKQRTVT